MTRTTGAWNRLSSYKTTIANTGDGGVTVTYHHTHIVDANRDIVRLDTDGWKGFTTKRKMNQAARQFDLGYTVHQVNHEWFVTTKAGVYPFVADTFTFDRATGVPAGASFSQMALASIGKLKHKDCHA